jgi:hypothetical protein
MAKRKNDGVPMSRAKETDDERTIYAILREEFTPEDLQRYTEEDEGIPIEKVIAEVEAIQRSESRKKRGKKKP